VLTSNGMPNPTDQFKTPFDLAASARAEMIREGFHLGEPDGADVQLAQIRRALTSTPPQLRDLTALLWSSIDNDTSRDLDQIEFAEQAPGGIRVLIGIADVAAAVARDTPLDRAAAAQTQTVYTAGENFPMLPFELSTDLTSLNPDKPRQAIICEFTVGEDGIPATPSIYAALALNRAQLAYSTTGPFLEGKPRPDGRRDAQLDDPILAAQLRLQDEAAQRLHRHRVQLGALDFNRVEADPVVIDGKIQAIQAVAHNRASDLIENFMIAANETMAVTLRNAGRSCIRRVVRSPERWDRIVALVATKGGTLPAQPDSYALNAFLEQQRTADAVHYPDLALAVIKLMGPGEYVLARGDDPEPPGHFSLAALDYTHSTAPNRRFADLVTQRIVKAMLANEAPPYTDDELATLGQHINERDSMARKVERTMQKRVAAVALAGQVGQQFRGVITGATPKGTFVRVFNPPVEGRILSGYQGLDVGDQVIVTLSKTDPLHAFIDFTNP
jgi:VacB/RNase II family 3'-5' exoribonuclease